MTDCSTTTQTTMDKCKYIWCGKFSKEKYSIGKFSKENYLPHISDFMNSQYILKYFLTQ